MPRASLVAHHDRFGDQRRLFGAAVPESGALPEFTVEQSALLALHWSVLTYPLHQSLLLGLHWAVAGGGTRYQSLTLALHWPAPA